MTDFGELKNVDIRSVWPHEAAFFTPWLAKNIKKLGDALGLELELTEQEADVGDFALDILAKDLGTGRNVIIENQFGGTNHDHLGKLLTYASGYDASTIIWIAETIRDEHRQALDWLNQRTDASTDFFAVTVELFRVDESKPVVRFNPVVYPNEWAKGQGHKPSDSRSPRAEAYRVFFQQLIDELRDKYHFTGAKVAQPQNWYSFSSGFSGITYGFSFGQGDRAKVELYIDLGESAPTKELFDWLQTDKQSIEKDFGEPLSWERLEDRRASRVALYRPGSIDDEQKIQAEIKAWAIQNLLKMKRVMEPRLSKSKISNA
jgi:hypothetical protein